MADNRAWKVDEEEWHRAETPRDRLRHLVRYGVLAPSSHNTQPWQFRLGDAHLDLRIDRTRALPVADPDDRELTISCGAALFHVRVAIAHFGREPLVDLLPEPSDPDLLARVRLGDPMEPGDREEAMFTAIPERRTNRGPFVPEPLPEALVERLSLDAEHEGAWLRVASDAETKGALADLVAEGDHIQMADRRFRRELSMWVHSNRSRHRDGIPGYAFGMSDATSLLGPLVIRLFDMGKGQATRDRSLAEGSPALAVLGTLRDDEGAWLAAGQALARVLLEARAHGIDASYLNQPIQVPELRGRVAPLVSQPGSAQVLVRLGRPAEDARPEPTPRRLAEDVLWDEGSGIGPA